LPKIGRRLLSRELRSGFGWAVRGSCITSKTLSRVSFRNRENSAQTDQFGILEFGFELYGVSERNGEGSVGSVRARECDLRGVKHNSKAEASMLLDSYCEGQ
jgi:hypothetical protein